MRRWLSRVLNTRSTPNAPPPTPLLHTLNYRPDSSQVQVPSPPRALSLEQVAAIIRENLAHIHEPDVTPYEAALQLGQLLRTLRVRFPGELERPLPTVSAGLITPTPRRTIYTFQTLWSPYQRSPSLPPRTSAQIQPSQSQLPLPPSVVSKIPMLEPDVFANILKYLSPEDRHTMMQVFPECAPVALLRQFPRIIFKNARKNTAFVAENKLYDKLRDESHRIFVVEEWKTIENTLRMCAHLESVKLFDLDFMDKWCMPAVGELLWRVRSLELRYCRQLHLNGLKHLVNSTVELREFAFYYKIQHFRDLYDRPAELASDIFQNLLTRNRKFESLTIWDDVHDYSTFIIDRPITSINIKAATMTRDFWQSLRATSRESLRRYISPRYSRDIEGEPVVFTNLTDLRLGRLNFVPFNWNFPKIEILTLRFINLGFVGIQSTRVQWTYGAHPQLRILDVNFHFSQELHFHAMCHTCPQLRVLRVTIGYNVTSVTIRNVFRLKNLEVLCLFLGRQGYRGQIRDSQLAEIVHRLPKLRVLYCITAPATEQTFNAFAIRALRNPEQLYIIGVNHHEEGPPNLLQFGSQFFDEHFYNITIRTILPISAATSNIFDTFDYFLWKHIPIPNA